jgi:hypothetical protein
VEIPPSLNTPAFLALWAKWNQYLLTKPKKNHPNSISGEFQLKKLDKMGEKRALAALAHSISNNWIGIFEPEEPMGFAPTKQETVPEMIARHQKNNPERVRKYKALWAKLARADGSDGKLKPENEWLAWHLPRGTNDDKFGAYIEQEAEVECLI